MTTPLKRKPLWSRGARLCQVIMVMSSAWGRRHAWAEAATARGESTTTTTAAAVVVSASGEEVRTTARQQHTALGLETPGGSASKTPSLGATSATPSGEDRLRRGTSERPLRPVSSSWPFEALQTERRRQDGGWRRSERNTMEEGVPMPREGREEVVEGVAGAGADGIRVDARVGGGSRRDGMAVLRHRRPRNMKKSALQRRGGTALVFSRDFAHIGTRETRREEEGLLSPVVEIMAVTTGDHGDTTPHRQQFGRKASTVSSTSVEHEDERRAVNHGVRGALPFVVAAVGRRTEKVDTAEKEDGALPGSVGSIFVQGRRRAADEQAGASPHESQGQAQGQDDDDEVVDGFGSVGLLAFLVCFGLLFCVLEVAKCYCLVEGRRRRQLRRRREQNGDATDGRMPIALSRPVAPSVPEAGSKAGWVEVVIDDVATSGEMSANANARDMPSAKGYPVADASHALRQAVEEAQRMSPNRGFCNNHNSLFSPSAPAAGPSTTARAQPRPSPAPMSVVTESPRHIV